MFLCLFIIAIIGLHTVLPTYSIVFWHIGPCSMIEIHRYFGSTCWLHLQVERRRFYSENTDSLFYRYIDTILPQHMASQPRKKILIYLFIA